MSQSCGTLQYMEGGTLKGASILNTQITDSVISNSTLQGVAIKNLAEIDAASIKTIVDAIAAMPGDQLTTLVNALLSAIVATPQTEPVQSTGQGEIPVTIIGNRSALLGQPVMFTSFGTGYVIPLYRPETR